MAYSHFTATGPFQVQTNRISTAIITVNTGFTGSITVSDETATAGTPVVGVITNPVTGGIYEYWDLKNGLTINPSTTCDITVSTYSGRG